MGASHGAAGHADGTFRPLCCLAIFARRPCTGTSIRHADRRAVIAHRTAVLSLFDGCVRRQRSRPTTEPNMAELSDRLTTTCEHPRPTKRCLATTGTTRSTRTCGAFFRRRTSSAVPSSSTGLFGARAASSTNSRSGWRVSQQGGSGAFGIARRRLLTSIVLCHDLHIGTTVRGRGRMGEARSKLHAVR